MSKCFHWFSFVIALWLIIAVPTSAHAYIGPGMGAGAVAVVLGVLGSIFLAIFAVVYYPIKRALKKRRKAANPAQEDITE